MRRKRKGLSSKQMSKLYKKLEGKLGKKEAFQVVGKLKLESIWQEMGTVKRAKMRRIHKDSDKDGVPNKWDCKPYNKYKQDTETKKLRNEYLDQEHRDRLRNLLNDEEDKRIGRDSEIEYGFKKGHFRKQMINELTNPKILRKRRREHNYVFGIGERNNDILESKDYSLGS